MAKTLMTLFLVVAFFIISQDVVTAQCQCKGDCNITCESGLPTCVDGVCVCLALETYSTIHKDVVKAGECDCHNKADCRQPCESGLPTCVDGFCVCLALKTDSTNHKG
ncbi:PREDICTED: putative defensin-like protein 298 [Nicotiana attenuata]|uniref:Defensin-like protein 298 n=1 Tax=Nicotiana attenuata TaxID=49451 RepID=A0A1J6I4R9_NICAT|nr:PREDICTED: putative defensin-like protein 298 [Nicotiana attenuata]OIS99475.1 hypothetical protein A4A49_19821 [Nicotiana attenuata]